MREYRVFIVPKEIITYGEDEAEAIENAIEHIKEYKDILFVAKEVEKNEQILRF